MKNRSLCGVGSGRQQAGLKPNGSSLGEVGVGVGVGVSGRECESFRSSSLSGSLTRSRTHSRTHSLTDEFTKDVLCSPHAGAAEQTRTEAPKKERTRRGNTKWTLAYWNTGEGQNGRKGGGCQGVKENTKEILLRCCWWFWVVFFENLLLWG